METLKEFDNFIWSIPGNDMWRHGNLDKLQSGVGVQGLHYESLSPARFTSEVCSVAIVIGKTRPQEEDRQATCQVYFGMSFDDLSHRLKLGFGANDRGISQIKCEEDRQLRGFVEEIFARPRGQTR